MPISAPKPNSSPSVKRVDAFTTTAPASTSSVNRRAAARSRVRIASVWPVPNRLTCSIAASSDGTTATLILSAEELAAEVVVGRLAHRRHASRARRRRRPARRPARRSASATAGRNASATASCTTSDSAALHTLGRWVLALTTMSSASSRSADGVDVDVAVAVAVDDDGHGRVVADALDQRRTAARDEAVDDVGELHELDRGLVADVVDEQHRVVGEPGLGERRRAAPSAIARFERSAPAEPAQDGRRCPTSGRGRRRRW